MTPFKKSANGAVESSLASPEGKLHLIVGRVDLVAIITVLLSLCLFGFLAAATAIVQVVKLISSLWSDSFDRWLIVACGVAIVWVAARWKKLCAF
jgi:hypothetical protein